MRASILATSVFLFGCGASVKFYTRTEPGAEFRYHTFAVVSDESAPTGFHRLPVATEIQTVINDAATTRLVDKGYRVASLPDLVIHVGVGKRRARREDSQEQDATGSQVTADDPDGSFNYDERALVFDVFDTKTQRRVWQGIARQIMTTDKVDLDAVRRAVNSIFDRMPGPATM